MEIRENEIHRPIIEKEYDLNNKQIKNLKIICPICNKTLNFIDYNEHTFILNHFNIKEDPDNYTENYCSNCGARLK